MPTDTGRRDPYAVLRYRDFRLLIGGRFIAQVGEMMVSVSVGWELYERTNDPFALGLVGLVQVIPVMLFSLPGGYVADRFDRRWVTLISQVVLIVCSLILTVMALTQAPLLLLYATLALIGAARAFNNPAEAALTPMIIPKEHYYAASAWSTSIWQLSAISGPAIGGLIIGFTGIAAPVYFINSLAGLVLVVALLLIRSRQVDYHAPDEPPLQALRGGIRFMRSAPVILASISLDMFAVLLGGAVFLLPVFARDILHTDATGLGWLRAAGSIGALLMALYLARREPFAHAGRTLLLAVAGFGLATIVFGLSTSFWLSMAMLALMGALDNISVVIRHTLLLTYTPDPMRGRVDAVSTVFIGTSNELGGFESGVAAGILGPVGAVVFGGLGTLAVVGLVALKAPQLRRLRRIGEDESVVNTPAAAPKAVPAEVVAEME